MKAWPAGYPNGGKSPQVCDVRRYRLGAGRNRPTAECTFRGAALDRVRIAERKVNSRTRAGRADLTLSAYQPLGHSVHLGEG